VTIGYNPKPLAILSNYVNNTQVLCTQIAQLVQSERAEQVIVGLPLHKNGTVAEQTLITREFAQRLKCTLYATFGPDRVPIYLWDERYTSKEAEARARALSNKKDASRDFYGELDADAACIILEHYYADGGLDAERVELPDDDEVRQVVEEAWQLRVLEINRDFKDMVERRNSNVNARQLAMERGKILEEKLARENMEQGDSHSNKKKRPKKKRSFGGGVKWITL